MVIVDDGSDEATQAVLASLELPIPLRVMRQTNQGRFRAREAGIRESYGELILLIDSRVSIAPGALRFVHGEAHGSAIHGAWNAHVNVLLEGNSFARFWNVLTEISFAEYFDNPRTTSFGEEDFDRFPKGTTCFLAPKDDLLKAIEAFESHFADPAMANDDTNLIRILARTERINISPNFACTYRSRNGSARSSDMHITEASSSSTASCDQARASCRFSSPSSRCRSPRPAGLSGGSSAWRGWRSQCLPPLGSSGLPSAAAQPTSRY